MIYNLQQYLAEPHGNQNHMFWDRSTGTVWLPNQRALPKERDYPM